MKTIEIANKHMQLVAIPYVKEFKVQDGVLYVYGKKDEVICIFSDMNWEYVRVTHQS